MNVNNSKRILFEIINLEIAGAQKVMIDLAICFRNKGYDVVVVVLSENPGNHFSDTLRTHNIRTYYIDNTPNRVMRVFERYSKLSEVIQKEKPDIIHNHLDYSYMWLYAFMHKVSFITTLHSQSYRLARLPIKLMYKLLYMRGLITPVILSDNNAIEFTKLFKTQLRDIYVIPNPIDLSLYAPIEKYSDKQKVVFCLAARFNPIKNHEMLLRAFSNVLKAGLNCELLLAGDGETRSDMEKLVASLGIGNEVVFLGTVDDIPSLLRRVDVGVMCSNSEAFPLFLLECMASGIPMIVTNVGDISEIVGNSACIVEKGDVDSLAKSMKKLAGDAEMRHELGKNAIDRAKRYDISVVANMYEELYTRVYL